MHLEHNVKQIAAALRAVGAVAVTANYIGSGDEGEIYQVDVHFPEQDAADREIPKFTGDLEQLPVKDDVSLGNVSLRLEVSRFDESSKKWSSQTEERPFNFESAVEEVAFDAVRISGHGGWENNDGGGGTFTVFANERALLDHYDNVIEQEHDRFKIGPDEGTPVGGKDLTGAASEVAS